jgi:hypothetical protein
MYRFAIFSQPALSGNGFSPFARPVLLAGPSRLAKPNN